MRNDRSFPGASSPGPSPGSYPGPAGKLTTPTIPPASKGVIAGMILILHENFQTPPKRNYSPTEFSSLVGSVRGGRDHNEHNVLIDYIGRTNRKSVIGDGLVFFNNQTTAENFITDVNIARAT